MLKTENQYRILRGLKPEGTLINGPQNSLNREREQLKSVDEEKFKDESSGNIELIEKEAATDTEVRIVDENGKIFWTDEKIKELLNATKALRESEEKNRLLMENSGLGIGYFEKDGKILTLNQEAIKKLGGKVSDYIGKNLAGVYGKEISKVFINRLRLAAESEDSLQYEDNLKLSGKEVWYLSTYTRILNDKGYTDSIQVTANNITESRIAEKKLRDSQKMLQKLAGHMDEIMENERSQIALNLHDDLGQKLTAINMNIAWVKSRMGVQSPAVRKKLEEMSQIITETIDSIKEISSFLRPLILFDLGVVPAFDSLLKKFYKQSGIRCNFIYDHEEFQLDKRISLTLYRILQESLTNIARHSGASVADFKLRLLRNKVELHIKDNGRGIDENEVNSFTSMGITGLKERVNSLGGILLIKGEKGAGTSIKVSIPLKSGNKDD